MTEDLFTRFIALLAAAVLVPSVVFLAMSITEPTMRYWRWLTLGFLAIFVGATFGAMQEILPKGFTPLVSNLLIGIGYFLNTRAVHSLGPNWGFQRLDRLLLAVFVALVLAMTAAASSYETRVAVVSLGIAGFTAIMMAQVYSGRTRFSTLAVAILLAVCGLNISISAMRSVAALIQSDALGLSLLLWDPVFFIGSIAVVFGFAIGFFILGSNVISERTNALLTRERQLTQKLHASIEDQKNLQLLLMHEIKRPINAMSALVQSGVVDAARRQELSNLMAQATTSLEEIGAYEELSRLFEHPNMAPLSLAAIADDLRSKWRIDVTITPDLAVDHIQGDALLVDVALGNLVENAMKFGGDCGPVRMLINGDATCVHFDVTDGGPGIPPEEWDKVWGKFYRSAGLSANALSGCGLGLFAVQSIAKAHGGVARVTSQTPSQVRFSVPTDIGHTDVKAG